MKVSLITTVLNEENSIKSFIDSVLSQTRLPDELVIVDGGSTDGTVSSIKYQVSSIKRIKVRIINKQGNRSVGRNTAIKSSTGDIIAVSDVGCILDNNWLKNLVLPFKDKSTDVVAGYYKGRGTTVFQKCVVPYALVMFDKVNPSSFLPATRSMAFRKSIWKKAGNFNEKLSHNEDYVFAKMLKKIDAHIFFEKSAVVYWIPRRNIAEFYTMNRRFAYGDAEAGIYRPKALFIIARYMLGILFLVFILLTRHYSLFTILYFLLFFYLLWSILKNYKYVKHPKAFLYLPLLQITSDIAVISGMTIGFLRRLMGK